MNRFSRFTRTEALERERLSKRWTGRDRADLNSSLGSTLSRREYGHRYWLENLRTDKGNKLNGTTAVAGSSERNESTFRHRWTLRPAVQGQDHGRCWTIAICHRPFLSTPMAQPAMSNTRTGNGNTPIICAYITCAH